MMSIEATNIDENGFHLYGEIIDKDDVSSLYRKMLRSRDFGKSLFLSEGDYLSQKNHFGTNPTNEFNFLNGFSEELGIIEKNPKIVSTLEEVLGDDYEVVIKKAVCGVPESWLPEWVKNKIRDVNVANLGPYIKPEYRDITYFRGIDFHQDIIDWPTGSTDLDPSAFLTLYVYLHDVNELDSPLHILPKTHKLGATLFPHQLTRVNKEKWLYQDDSKNRIESNDTKLVGGAGLVGIWHNCLLHGTQPVRNESDRFRISLRYLIGKSKDNAKKTSIYDINRNIKGSLRPIRTRFDLNKKGQSRIKGNVINQI